MLSKSWKLEKLVFILLMGLYLVPVWLFPYFPTQDGPSHLDTAVALRNYFDPDLSLFREYYTLNLRLVPNWVTTTILIGLTPFVPVITAEKLLISGYFILLPLSIRYALSAIDRDSMLFSILAFPLIYNHLAHRGFYNFIYSVPMFFFAIGYWLRHRYSFRLPEIFCLGILVLLLYFCHIVGFVLFGLTLLILASSFTLPAAIRDYHRELSWLQYARQVFSKPLWIALLWVAPALLLAGKFLLEQGSPPSYSRYPWQRLVWPLYGLVATTNSPLDLLVSMSVSALFVAVLYYSINRRLAQINLTSWDGFLLAAAISCLLYFVAPDGMSGGGIIAPRFMVFALLLLILWFGTQNFSKRARFHIGVIATGLAMLLIVLNLVVYARINKDAKEYLSGMETIEPNTTLLALCFANEGCGVGRRSGYLRVSPLSHLSGYISAQRHLINLHMPHPQTNYFPIRYRDQLDLSPYLTQRIEGGKRVWGGNVADYTRQTGRHIDYVLLWGIADAWREGEDTNSLLKWLSEEYDLIFTSPQHGMLQIYRKKDFVPSTIN